MRKSRRLVLGAVARAAGYGGPGAVAAAAGVSWQTVAAGVAEMGPGDGAAAGAVRRAGAAAGRPRRLTRDWFRRWWRWWRTLPGRPVWPLRWTAKSMKSWRMSWLRGAPVRAADGVAAAAPGGVQRAGEREGDRGEAASGPGRPARYIIGRASGDLATGTGGQRGCQEEGAGRRVRPGRAGMAAEGGSGPVREHGFADKETGEATPYGVSTSATVPGSSAWAPTMTRPRSRSSEPV